ncbi:MAG: radical SAM protein, partial [Lachnospiraceae bacterium]|nr:radical SAM protein [Lachnospiraceae bacterium]
MNQYETDAMEARFREKGYEIVPFTDAADIYIVNTCTVTAVADKKSRQMLHRAKKLNPDAFVVAAGCYADEAGDRLLADPDIDMIAVNAVKDRLPEIIEERLGPSGGADLTCGPERYRRGSNTRAYVKIQDGCDQYCSYCIIPFARGHIKSRGEDEIIEEIKMLTAGGYREAVLTGIHISSYGLDKKGLTYNRCPDDPAFGELVKRICSETGI